MKNSKLLISLAPLYTLVLVAFIVIATVGSKTVSVMVENSSEWNRTCIVIDAGHGGEDGGAVSCDGIYESKVNLQIALKLQDIMHLLGLKTKMIRATDISIYTEGNTIAQKKISDLKERVRIVNETENALLLSIHQNYFAQSQYHGAQVFYSEAQGSKALAELLQSQLKKTLNPGSNRQVKKAEGVYLMQRIQCTGVLVECGFLSNPTEAALLQDPSYQLKLCCTIATVCNNYVNTNYNMT